MFSSVIGIVFRIRNCYYIFQNKNCDSTRKRNAVICECVSSLLPLAGNRDDIKYENSHLLAALKEKFKNVYTIVIMPIMLFSAWTYFFRSKLFFLKRLVTRFTGCHPCYQM